MKHKGYLSLLTRPNKNSLPRQCKPAERAPKDALFIKMFYSIRKRTTDREL